MRADTPFDPTLIRRYEGVVRKTAALTAERCEEEFDDICQRFRIKVWKALVSYDPSKLTNEKPDASGRTPRDRYVFACIKNEAKDLEKKVKRSHRVRYIEDMVEDGDDRLLGVEEDQVFNGVEEVAPLIPSTLDERERQIVALLYLDFDNGEIGERLGIKRKQVATLVRGIRVKLADWAPEGWQPPSAQRAPAPPPAPPVPLPVAAVAA